MWLQKDFVRGTGGARNLITALSDGPEQPHRHHTPGAGRCSEGLEETWGAPGIPKPLKEGTHSQILCGAGAEPRQSPAHP